MSGKTKTCARCKAEKSISQFGTNLDRRNSVPKRYYISECRECKAIRGRARYLSDPQGARDRVRTWREKNAWKVPFIRMKKTYGLTPEQYEKLVRDQDGRCGACKKKLPLVIDHCHVRNAVRGLLCSQCNKGIGFLQDDTAILSGAIDYLNSNANIAIPTQKRKRRKRVEFPDDWNDRAIYGSRSNKLTIDDVLHIRRSNKSGKELAEKYGVSRAAVSRIKNFKMWTNVEE